MKENREERGEMGEDTGKKKERREQKEEIGKGRE